VCQSTIGHQSSNKVLKHSPEVIQCHLFGFEAYLINLMATRFGIRRNRRMRLKKFYQSIFSSVEIEFYSFNLCYIKLDALAI